MLKGHGTIGLAPNSGLVVATSDHDSDVLQTGDSSALTLNAVLLPGEEEDETHHRGISDLSTPFHSILRLLQLGSPFLLSELREHVSSRFLLAV